MRIKSCRKNIKKFGEVEVGLEKNVDKGGDNFFSFCSVEGSIEGILLKLAAGTVNTLINVCRKFHCIICNTEKN